MPRMNILNAVEREAFDSPPVFNSFQRKQYFDFPSITSERSQHLRGILFLHVHPRLSFFPRRSRSLAVTSAFNSSQSNASENTRL